MSEEAAVLGKKTWRLLFQAQDIRQEVFNLAYHLKQSVAEVMAWPSTWRRDQWQRVLDQYEFEKSEHSKS